MTRTSSRWSAIMHLGLRSGAFARHVYQKVAALTFGAVFVSPTGRRLRLALAQLEPPVRRPHIRPAIIAHLYYLDLLPEILECRAALSEQVMLHLTVPEDRVEQARLLVREIDAVEIHACKNRGRDIGPFMTLLNAGTFDDYDVVLKLHTKRSPHLLDGEIRRKLLFNMLSGERNATLRTLAVFENPTTGIVGWADCWRTAPPYWMANEQRVRQIATSMGASAGATRLGFFEGSMFWFRPAAFAALRELNLQPEDFEPEERQLDGTLHHAVERCFTIAAWARGLTVRDLRGRILG